MESHDDFYKKALTSFKTADHLVYVTFNVVRDHKIILTALENLSNSLTNGMNAILEYERLYKRIMPLADNFESRFDVFKKVFEKYGFSNEEMSLIVDLKKFLEERKDAPLEFTRSNKVVICYDNYKMRSVSLDDAKKYLSTTKTFLFKVNKVLKNV